MADRFTAWLFQYGYSPFTVRNYSAEVGRFRRWLSPVALEAASRARVRTYVLGGADRGEPPATTNLRLCSLRRYYQWSRVSMGRPPLDPTAGLRLRMGAPRAAAFLSDEAIRVILAGIGDRIRDRAVFLVFVSCGLKLRELVALNRSDLMLAADGARLTAAGREIPIPPEASEALRAYLAQRRDDDPALFLSREGHRLGARTIQGTFARFFAEARVSGSVRTLRHSFAARWASAGISLRELQHLLGHRSLQSTQAYLAFAPSRLRSHGERNSADEEPLPAEATFARPFI